MHKRAILALVLIGLLAVACPAHAQPPEITVPDLSGLNAPAAAAELARAGLRLGRQTGIPADDQSRALENTVYRQSPEAGTPADAGTAVDIEIVRAANARLIYDDNDITLLNLGAEPVDLTGVAFAALGGADASFAAVEWTAQLDPNDCGQLWSVVRTVEKRVAGCGLIRWKSTTDRSIHFWTTAAGSDAFAVTQDGDLRAQCPAAGPAAATQPLTCDFVLDVDYAFETLRYIYIVSTPDVLAVVNQSADRWMAPDLARIGPRPIGDVARLAPGQCHVFRVGEGPLPVVCDVVAQTQTASEDAFWRRGFVVVSSDGVRRACSAAIAGEVSVCVLPR